MSVKKALTIIVSFLYAPLLFLYYISSAKELIKSDLKRLKEIKGTENQNDLLSLLLHLNNREFRTQFYHRVKCSNLSSWILSHIFQLIYKPSASLIIYTSDIGPGLFIQHGISTIVAAKKIGVNAWINQQVTIGHNGDLSPIIGDNVTIRAGAKVIGEVHVGNNSIVGANAVVVKDVPPNCVVVGVPAKIVRRDGKRVDESS